MQERRSSRERARIDALRKKVDAPILVGDCEDILPYHWRTPLTVDERTCSKLLREILQEERNRATPTGTKEK